jgi:hypothetical protein
MNSVLTIRNHSASPVTLSTVIPTELELTVPALGFITVSLPDNFLNPLIAQCARRGLVYDLWSD